MALFLIATLTQNTSHLKAQTSDLFFSEYVEGSSFNKAIELYNGTAFAIDLAAGQYLVQVYYNGSTTSNNIALTGTINPGTTMVLAHTQATLGITPAMTSTVLNFNGNDAVVLRKNGTSGQILDIIGQVGVNPGTQWGGNDTSTFDRTLRRKPSICNGTSSTLTPFYPGQQWDGYPLNTTAGLGSHSTSCSSSGLLVIPSTLSFTAGVLLPSLSQSLTLLSNVGLGSVNFSVSAPFQIANNPQGPFSSTLLATPLSTITVVWIRLNAITSGNFSTSVSITTNSIQLNAGVAGTCYSHTSIPVIQGSGSVSPVNGNTIVTAGVVTGDFQNPNGLGGFFMQDTVGDNNTATSDGIFVSNTTYSVSVGDYLVLSAKVSENSGRTQLIGVDNLLVTGTCSLPSPQLFSLPFSNTLSAEKLEGMLVQPAQNLVVSDVYNLGRFGEAALSYGRLINPTHVIDPNDNPASGVSISGNSNVGAIITQQNFNTLNQIILDDGSNFQNPAQVPYVDILNNTLRCGSTLTPFNAIMDYAFSNWRLQPTQNPQIQYAVRPQVPSTNGANLKIASFNVLNYFNGDGFGAGFPTSRGASSLAEFNRQKAKIALALTQLNADIVSLMEIENDGCDSISAIADLVNALNAATSAGTYSFVADPSTMHGGTGTDEIKVSIIYKPNVVVPVNFAIADSNTVFDRRPLAQTFRLQSNQEKITVIATHLKSKSCSGSTGNDTDQNDGQGCFNTRRNLQAARLAWFADSALRWGQTDKAILLGDFNADDEEDPIDNLRSLGWRHLLDGEYSFVFDGQAGALDHAFVSDSLFAKFVDGGKWHINADEPVCKDYNLEYNQPSMFNADPFRSSDHDPLLVGFILSPQAGTVDITGVKSNRQANTFLIRAVRESGEVFILPQDHNSELLEFKLYSLTGAILSCGKNITLKNNTWHLLSSVDDSSTIVVLVLTTKNGQQKLKIKFE